MAKKEKTFQKEIGNFKNVKPVLKPLNCSACGIPIPLSEKEIIHCFACGTENMLPPEYIELQRSKKQHQEGMKQAEELLKKISKPPNALMMAWYKTSKAIANTFGVIMAILLWISGFSFLVVLFIIYMIFYLIAPSIHINLIDVYGPGNVYALTFIAISIVFVLPLVLNSYISNFVELRKTLQASLAAKLPEHGSGNASCRGCGAPIVLEKNSLCVKCVYCDTENLATIPEAWMKTLKGFASWHFKTVNDALETEKKFRKGLKNNIRNWFLLSIAAGGLFWLLGQFISWVDNDPIPIPTWSEVSKTDREMVVLEEFSGEGFVSVPYNTIVTSSGLASNYWISLQYNEKFIFQCWDFPNEVDIYVYNTTNFDAERIFDKLNWTQQADSSWQISWTAPYKGLFGITTQIYGSVEKPFKMKWWTE